MEEICRAPFVIEHGDTCNCTKTSSYSLVFFFGLVVLATPSPLLLFLSSTSGDTTQLVTRSNLGGKIRIFQDIRRGI